MVEFDKNKFQSDYVYIKKITQNYIYVLSDFIGNVYLKKGCVKGSYQGKKVTKIKIHNAVYFNYIKHNSIVEFYGSGRLGCISYYDGKIINVEIQRMNFKSGCFDSPNSWKSTFEGVIERIGQIVPNDSIPYIDGKEIFWLVNDNFHKLSEDGCFTLREVNYLDMARIGLQIEKNNNVNKTKTKIFSKIETDIKPFSILGLSNYRSISDILNLNFSSIEKINSVDKEEKSSLAFVKSGVVICYNPFFGDNDNIQVYSPVLRRNEKGKKSKSEVTDIYNIIDSSDNKLFLNLNFVLKSANVIGELYGYDETNILNIPDIIQNTGIICLNKIEENSRKNYAISLDKWEGFAWIFKYIYNEKDLYNILDLNKLFKYLMNNGLIAEKKITNIFVEGKDSRDIKNYNVKQIFWDKKESLKSKEKVVELS